MQVWVIRNQSFGSIVAKNCVFDSVSYKLPMSATVSEVPHDLHLSLLQVGTDEFYLLHKGTGERFPLRTGLWSLHFNEYRMGALRCQKVGEADESWWANSLLSSSLHEVQPTPNSPPKFMVQMHGGQSSWIEDLAVSVPQKRCCPSQRDCPKLTLSFMNTSFPSKVVGISLLCLVWARCGMAKRLRRKGLLPNMCHCGGGRCSPSGSVRKGICDNPLQLLKPEQEAVMPTIMPTHS